MSLGVFNRHARRIAVPPARAGLIIDYLASPGDSTWPTRCWPALQLDRPLGVGARGGHGPIRYAVVEYVPGTLVRFRFTAPTGFDGGHAFRIKPVGNGIELIHELQMRARGPALLTWPLLYRPLHDALVEDAFACAQALLGEAPVMRPWPWRVRLLRWLLSRGTARPQSELLCPRTGNGNTGPVSCPS